MIKVVSTERTEDGWTLRLEHPNAYTKGRSRFSSLHLRHEDVTGKSREEIVKRAQELLSEGLESLRDADLDEPVEDTKAVLLARLREQVYDVANLITVRNEAEALVRPQAEIDAWTKLRNARYFAALETLEAWMSAEGN